MAKKMSKEQAAKVGSRVERVFRNAKNVTFKCKSNADGKTVRDIIVNAFSPKSVTRYNYDIEWMFTVGMSEWKEFRAKFASTDDADVCYKEVSAAIRSYQSDDEDAEDEPVTTYTPKETATPDEETDEETKTVDWSTYIIIGVAVVAVIVILLWGRNKK